MPGAHDDCGAPGLDGADGCAVDDGDTNLFGKLGRRVDGRRRLCRAVVLREKGSGDAGGARRVCAHLRGGERARDGRIVTSQCTRVLFQRLCPAVILSKDEVTDWAKPGRTAKTKVRVAPGSVGVERERQLVRVPSHAADPAGALPACVAALRAPFQDRDPGTMTRGVPRRKKPDEAGANDDNVWCHDGILR